MYRTGQDSRGPRGPSAYLFGRSLSSCPVLYCTVHEPLHEVSRLGWPRATPDESLSFSSDRQDHLSSYRTQDSG
jgi:hypothetical protein